MSRSRRAELVADEWLVELAAQDDPPTVIDATLLARFGGAGVEQFVPAAGTAGLAVEDAARATGIGAVGPGFGFAESLEDEPARVAAALARLCEWVEGFDRLRRLRLAARDMRLVAAAARALAERDGAARVFDRVLETGIVVTYARPYLASNSAGVGGKWRPRGEADRKLHEWIVDELRHSYYAHADRTPRRTLVDTTASLGLEGPPTFAEAWWNLTEDELTRIADLAERQASRLEAAALEVGAELGEKRDPPSDGQTV